MTPENFSSFVLLIWFAGALIAGSAAYRKGRSGLAWFVLSLIFGPIAWLVLAAVSPIREESQT